MTIASHVEPFDRVAEELGLDDAFTPWRERFAPAAARPPAAVLDPAVLDERMATARVDGEAAAALRRARAQIAADASLQLVLQHIHAEMLAPGREVDYSMVWPMLPQSTGEGGELIYALACLEEIPGMLRRFDQLGLPREVAVAGLQDIQRWLDDDFRSDGRWTFKRANWIRKHLNALIFELGRLQYLPMQLYPDHYEESADHPLRVGDRVLGVHIPSAGPLTPSACRDSLAAARAFFTRHDFGHRFKAFTCTCWMLDPQLADYLPADSNIIQFQRLFLPLRPVRINDDDIFQRVLGQSSDELATAPRRTTLQRLVIDHVRAGHRWRAGGGYLPFVPTEQTDQAISTPTHAEAS